VRRARTGTGVPGSSSGALPRRATRLRSHAGRRCAALLGSCGLLFAAPALAKPLDQLIPGLFGGSLNTTILQTGSGTDTQQAIIINKFHDLSAQLSTARSQIPIPSSSGAFSFAWDPDLDTFVRSEQSLGSLYAERAQTLGRHQINFGLTYQHISFDTLNGDSLDNIHSRQSAFTPAYLASLPEQDQMIYGGNVIDTRLSLNFNYDLFYLTAAYGLTDNIDVSMALTINRAGLSGHAVAMTIDPTGMQPSVGVFTPTQPGVITNGTQGICATAFRCAQDSINGSAVGTGDIYLRGKWHFADTRYVDFALAGVLTIPTGNADDFLGFHDPTFTPWLILSKNFGPFSPHLNAGYAIRSEEDVSQVQWIAGADYRALRWWTVGSDFLGFDNTQGPNQNVVQWSIASKFNPVGGLVLSLGFQFPVNRQGLRADVIYTGQVEYNF